MMSKKLLLSNLLASILITGGGLMTATAQTVNLEWVQQSGGQNFYTIANATVADKDGNVYTTGYFTGTVSFYQDRTPFVSTLTAFGEQDAFIMKHNDKGQIAWVKQFGYAGSYAAGNGIAFDNEQGFVTVAGHFTNKAGFTTKEAPFTSVGGQDIFVTRLGEDGSVTWTKTFGGKEYDGANGITVDGQSDIYVTGFFSDEIKFGTKYTFKSSVSTDAYLVKLQAEGGDIMWANQIMSSEGTDEGIGVAVNEQNVAVTGLFGGKGIIDPANYGKSITSVGNTDFYVIKLSKNNEVEWGQGFGGSEDDKAYGIAIDGSSNIYTTGRISSRVNFSPNGKEPAYLDADGKGDIFISKISPKGEYAWAKMMSGISRDEGKGITVDEKGNVYSIGDYLWDVDFNTGTGKADTFFVRSKGNAIYVHKLNEKGEFQWVKTFEAEGSSTASAIALGYDGAIHTTGYYNSTVDFDPNAGVKNLPALGNTDAFVHKMTASNCTNASTITTKACDNYTYNSVKYTTSGSYNHVFKNAAGCDSTVTLVLTINNSATKTLTEKACDSYVFDGKTLTASGTYTQKTVTSQGCDSTITLNLTINKSSTRSIKETTCDSFTLDNKLYYTQTGTYTQQFKTTAGCDSTIHMDLTINKSAATTVTETACIQYTLGDDEYTETGVYTLDLKTINGCDSTATLNLTIHKIDLTINVTDKVLTSNAVGATYQWLDCDKDMAPLAGETKQFLKATRNGNFAVEISKNDCKEISACYEIKGFETGIHERKNVSAAVYPNPARDNISIQLSRDVQQASLVLYNLLGQTMEQKEGLSGSLFSLDLSRYPTGVYILEANEGENSYRAKFVKE